jgi:diaminopimelate epimerase
MKIKFTKMHGAGNDFVVVDAIHQDIALTPAQWKFIADRRFGIGADQMLVVEKTTSEGIDFRYRIYNADGGEVEQCGNGARAFARFVSDKGLTTKRVIRVETMSGIIEPTLEDDGRVSKAEGEDALWPLDVDGKTTWISVVSMGNPHAVQLVADTEAAPVLTDGPLIERHARFPKRVNAGFMQVVDRHNVNLRVFERGVGETLACGTGACAAVVAGIRRGLLDTPVAVQTHGGELVIAWAGPGKPVMMTGPAVSVFEGEIDI